MSSWLRLRVGWRCWRRTIGFGFKGLLLETEEHSLAGLET